MLDVVLFSDKLIPMQFSLRHSWFPLIDKFYFHVFAIVIAKTVNSTILKHEFNHTRIHIINIQDKYLVKHKVQQRKDLTSPLNFARSQIHKIIESQNNWTLSVDTDVVVNDIFFSMFALPAIRSAHICIGHSSKLFNLGLGSKIKSTLRSEFKKRYHFEINESAPVFNAGAILYSNTKWKQFNISKETEYWYNLNDNKNLYSLGTQPALNLALHGGKQKCAQMSNICMDLGYVRKRCPKDTVLWHWNGKHKPYDSKYFDLRT